MLGNNNCMFIAATKFLGVEPPCITTGEVHEEIIIDMAIERGMFPVRICLFPVSTTKYGAEVNTYCTSEAIDRFYKFCNKYNGIIIGMRNGVWHADTNVANFDVIERGIFDLGGAKS